MKTDSDLLQAAIESFRYDKSLADRAIVQVSNECLHRSLNENTNSIVVLMKHIAGNLKSRWTDFLETDGEKPWRDRDSEFVDDFRSRDELIQFWESGWSILFKSLGRLTEADLERTVEIRGVPHSIPMAILRSNAHIAYHIGQIVMMARIHAGDSWTVLTIPPGKSREYNESNWGK